MTSIGLKIKKEDSKESSFFINYLLVTFISQSGQLPVLPV